MTLPYPEIQDLPHRWRATDDTCEICRVPRIAVLDAATLAVEGDTRRATSINHRCWTLGDPGFKRRLRIRVLRVIKRRAPRQRTRSPLRLTRKQARERRRKARAA